MKTKISVLVVLFVIFAIDISFAQTDLPKPMLIDGGVSRDLSDFEDLSNYFFKLKQGFIRCNNPIELHSVSEIEKNTPDPVPKYFRFNYDYPFFLSTNNISIGINGFKRGMLSLCHTIAFFESKT